MLRNRIFAYILWFIFFASLPNLAFVWDLNGKHPPARFHVAEGDWLKRKLKFFIAHRDRFNLIFLGDSKTHQGIDPQVIDRTLGNSYAYNMAEGAHWTDTQYAQFVDLVPHIPPGTWVVWSIGDNNFRRVLSFHTNFSYPISWKLVPDYLKFGFSLADVWSNVYAYNFFSPCADFVPGCYVYARRREYYKALQKLLEIPAASPASSREVDSSLTVPDEDVAVWEKVRGVFKRDPESLMVEPVVSEGHLIGVVVHKGRGNVLTVELAPEYFRNRQRENAKEIAPPRGKFRPDPEYWNIFLGILDLFQKNNIHLIVNELEQAPYVYSTPENYRSMRAFMEKVRKTVEARGIPYIRADFSLLGDDCYRDYNHLNSRGVVIYDQMLVAQIQKIRRVP
jgi:hypothetical protein